MRSSRTLLGRSRRLAGFALVVGIAVTAACLWSVLPAGAGVESWTSPASPPRGAAVQQIRNASGGLLMAAGEDGVFESGDGATWHAVGQGLTEVLFRSTLDVLESADGTLVASTNHGFYRLRGGDTSWTLLSSDANALSISCIAQHGGVLLGGRIPGVFRSLNLGATWTTATVNVSGWVRCMASTETTILAGTQANGLWYSTDDGDTWTQSDAGIGTGIAVNAITVAPNGDLWAATQAGVYRSTNGGGTWSLKDGAYQYMDVAVEPGGAIDVARWGRGVERAASPTEAFLPIGNYGVSENPRHVAVIGTSLIAGYTGPGVFRTTVPAGMGWQSANAGLPPLSVNATHVTKSGVMLAGANANNNASGLYRSADNGQTWGLVDDELITGYYVHDVAETSDGRVIVAATSGTFESTDTLTWSRQAGNNYVSQAWGVALSADESVTIVGAYQRVAIWHKGDTSFTDLPATGLPAASLSAVVQALDGSYVAAWWDTIVRLAPGSSTWVVPSGAPSGVSGFYRFADGTLCAGCTSTGLSLSADNGATWTAATGSTAMGLSRGIWGRGETVWVSTLNGVKRTTDRGATWTAMGGLYTQPYQIAGSSDASRFLLGYDGGALLWEMADTTPPGPVTTLVATPGNGQVALSWANPATDYAKTRVLRSTTSFATTTTPASGQTQVFDAAGTAVTDSGLTNGVPCYYTAFACDVVGNWSVAAMAVATPFSPVAPIAATSITIKTNATASRIGGIPILSGSVSPNSGLVGKIIVVYVKKAGKSYWTYSSNRVVYSLYGNAVWQYKYYFKRGMAKGVYTYKAFVPAYPGYLPSTSPTTVSVRVK
jgi:hypothetical protein